MHVCMYVCMYACMHVCILPPTHVHTQAVGTAESWDVYTLETSNSTDGERNHSCMVQRGSLTYIYRERKRERERERENRYKFMYIYDE